MPRRALETDVAPVAAGGYLHNRPQYTHVVQEFSSEIVHYESLVSGPVQSYAFFNYNILLIQIVLASHAHLQRL